MSTPSDCIAENGPERPDEIAHQLHKESWRPSGTARARMERRNTVVSSRKTKYAPVRISSKATMLPIAAMTIEAMEQFVIEYFVHNAKVDKS